MKRLLIFIPFVFMSCEEENVEPTPTNCNCYEYHERLESNLGSFSWVHDYSSTPVVDLCDKENAPWTYYDNDTKRYKFICE